MDGPRAATSLAAVMLKSTLSPKSSRSRSYLARFWGEWNLGTPERARFEQEYLLSIGRRS